MRGVPASRGLSNSFSRINPELQSKLLPRSPSSFGSFSLPITCCKQPSLPPPLSYLLKISEWADETKEMGMRKPRSLYNHDLWVEHRSSLRHVRHLLSSLSSRVILSQIPPAFSLTAVATTLAAYNSAVEAAWLPEFFPVLRASQLHYQLTAPALALLLVFRTEASYSRFHEGRHAWFKVVSGTHELAGMVIALSGNELSADAGTKKALLSYIMAFPVASRFVLFLEASYSELISPSLVN